MTYHRPTNEAANGKWRGILLELGVPETFLHDRLGPCPFCGGKDRFRFDNKDGSGSFYCNQCEPGRGMTFVERFLGLDFRDAAARVDAILGNHKVGTDAPPKPALTDEDRRAMLNNLWRASSVVQPDDLAGRYLAARGLGELAYPKALRFGAAVRDGEGGVRPCMLAMVTGPDGKPVTVHRTFIRPDGKAKAEMASARKLMPGAIPDGSAVRLSEFTTGTLGIAEGIETALAASVIFCVPVWAAINSAMLAKWQPPEGCDEVAIFGDNDPKHGGHAAAYALSHRLRVKGISTTISIPPVEGEDWLDDYTKGKSNG
ncbi:DUF7146 domain-containing protein [Oceaniglobus trochenteri]|uniref:DUF7146 domain-containing protein n=1 Tax=Oceaniglobus trochenteri TaxID=2763260 RepID=UPI001CFFBA57|nr:toprim domain-containing protein [Oceaniglobus trochenteri]